MAPGLGAAPQQPVAGYVPIPQAPPAGYAQPVDPDAPAMAINVDGVAPQQPPTTHGYAAGYVAPGAGGVISAAGAGVPVAGVPVASPGSYPAAYAGGYPPGGGYSGSGSSLEPVLPFERLSLILTISTNGGKNNSEPSKLMMRKQSRFSSDCFVICHNLLAMHWRHFTSHMTLLAVIFMTACNSTKTVFSLF